MRSLLVPVDGSPPSLRALDYAIAEAKALGDGASIHLVNVQHPVPSAVSDFVGRNNIDDFHREQSEKEIAAARQKLTESGVTFRTALLGGSPLQETGAPALPVVDNTGRLIGLFTPENVSELLLVRNALGSKQRRAPR